MKLRVLAGLALGSLALTACAGPTATTTSAPAPAAPSSAAPSTAAPPATSATPTKAAPAGSVAGTLTVWADDKRAAALKGVADKFAADNGVKVNVQAVSQDLQGTFVTASQAGNAPDIVVGAHDWIGNLVQNGAISPVTLTNKDAFDAKTIAAATYDGQVYGVPYMRENIALIRNTDLAPDKPATLDDLIAKGKELKAAGKVTEILCLPVGQNGDVYHMMPLMSAGGGSFFSYDAATGKFDAKNLTVASDKTVAAMEKIKAIGEGGATPALKRSIGNENAIPTFTGGKCAYLVSGPWAIADAKKANIKYDISAIPTWKDGGSPAAQFYGSGLFYVAAKGKNATLAQEFVTNYVGKADTQVALYNAEARPPALTAAFDQVKGSDPDLQKWADAGKDAIPMPAIPAMGKVWDPVGKAEAAIVGGADVKTTLTAAETALKTAIG